MTEEKKTRIAFVGVGGMGQAAHLRNYAHLGQCEVVALADPPGSAGPPIVLYRYENSSPPWNV